MADYNNTRLLEGLYTLGYPMGILNELAGQTSLPKEAFMEIAKQRGINPADWDKVNKLLEYRRGDKPMKTSLYEMMAIMGVSPQTQHAVQYAGDDPQAVLRALTSELGPERAGALMIKATNVKPPQGTVWNPFRGDEPPKGVDTRWGVKQGLPGPAGAYEGGMAGTRVGGQTTGLPLGATVGIEAGKQKPAPGATPGAPGGIDAPITVGGVGAGGGVPKAPDTRPLWVQQRRDPTPEEFDQYVHENFGAQAWFMDVPEVRQVIWDMAKGGLTDGAEAQRRVSATPWFKNTSASARTWYAHERADPATAQADIAEQTQTFITLSNKMGLEVPEDRIRSLAEASLRFGWNQDQINKALAKEFRYNPANKNQNAKVSEMKALANKYLVPLADETVDTWARGLLSGEFSDEQFSEYLKGTAKSLFPQLAQAIDSGVTVEDYVNPYKQIAAQRLEIPPDSINFMDTKWRSALDQIDPKTGQKRVMTLTEWEAQIKRDPQYGYDKTQQGVGEAAKLANELLTKFGQVA